MALRLVTTTVISATIIAGAVFAGGHAEKKPFENEINARRGSMHIQEYNLSVLGNMARGNTEYNADAAAGAAKNVYSALTIFQPGAWPPGSDASAVEGTRAKAEIWQNFPDVMEKMNAAIAEAQTMSEVAGNGLEAVQAQMRPLGQACTACHREYRAR